MKFLKVALFFFLTTIAVSQTSTEETDDTSVKGQFESLYKKSGSYQKYKVIEKNAYSLLQKSILDSVKNLKQTIDTKQHLINEHENKLASLQKEISTLNSQLEESSKIENQISFLGIGLTKANYNIFVWVIVFTLLGLLIFFMYRFKNSNLVTKETRILYEEIEQEFEQHKKKSLEKEQQLRRRLQDEINRQRGI